MKREGEKTATTYPLEALRPSSLLALSCPETEETGAELEMQTAGLFLSRPCSPVHPAHPTPPMPAVPPCRRPSTPPAPERPGARRDPCSGRPQQTAEPRHRETLGTTNRAFSSVCFQNGALLTREVSCLSQFTPTSQTHQPPVHPPARVRGRVDAAVKAQLHVSESFSYGNASVLFLLTLCTVRTGLPWRTHHLL